MKAFTEFLELWLSGLLLVVDVLCLTYVLETHHCICGIPIIFCFWSLSAQILMDEPICTVVPQFPWTQPLSALLKKRWIIYLWIAKTENCSVVQKFINYTLAAEVITLFKTMELDFAKILVQEFSMAQALRSRKKHFWNIELTYEGEIILLLWILIRT